MAKQATRKGGQRRSMPSSALPKIKLFRRVDWYSHNTASVGEYVSHLLMELGRLNLEVRNIEQHDRAPNRKTVLSDLMGWLSNRPIEAFANLFDWQVLDLAQLASRLEKDRSAKPRIEISAQITAMNNLSVRWYPGAWKHSELDWHRTEPHYSNLIAQRKWYEPPDFRWFTGDEAPTFDSRPSNELMYIRGVGNLRPKPWGSYGPNDPFNEDVVDSILICAVRAAYEGLINQLQSNFEIDVIDAFDFVIQEEVDESDTSPYRSPFRRVIAWSLEDAAELRARRERDAAAERERQERTELASIAVTHGFSLEVFVAAVRRASTRKANGSVPSDENVNRNAAKHLRDAGFKIDAGNVRRVRQLIERYRPEGLSEATPPE